MSDTHLSNELPCLKSSEAKAPALDSAPRPKSRDLEPYSLVSRAQNSWHHTSLPIVGRTLLRDSTKKPLQPTSRLGGQLSHQRTSPSSRTDLKRQPGASN